MALPRTKLHLRTGQPLVPRASRFPLRIGPSPIHGRGVFALEPIPAHRRVIEYTGQRISLREAQKRWDRLLRKMKSRGKLPPTYFFSLNRKRTIDGSVGGSGAELINHSCAPNLRARLVCGHAFYFSRRTIRKGEELTVDYRFRRAGPKLKCHCRSPRCRGTINRK